MIWAVVLLGAFLTLAAAFSAAPRPAKAIVALVGAGAIVFASFLTLAITSSAEGPGQVSGFSHAQLEADRIMTEQMSTAVGPGMQSVMATDGMLQRSANDAYVQALEQHVYEVDRMLGRVP